MMKTDEFHFCCNNKKTETVNCPLANAKIVNKIFKNVIKSVKTGVYITVT